MTTEAKSAPDVERAKRTAGRKPNPAGPGLPGDLQALQALGFGTLPQMSAAWVQGMNAMGSECMSFIAERIKEDVKTQHEILNCQTLEELQEIQTRFLKTAAEQYTAETGKLVEMGQTVLSGVVATRAD